jgi:adenylate cyclase
MCVYSRLGVIEKALDLLESRLKTTSINRAWIEHDSDLDNIRDHPRFKNALGKLK